ncbi:MAG: ABC transporter ATP-binding protein [Elusimicrobia bacterium]|nr:ABC transporter ATP-binding protein [Elusimicrobiota bacterium]
MMDVRGLVKEYGSTVAVADISFQVRPGEVVGLLGPNGAGKSTTLRVLTGYLPPTGGSVTLDGVDILENPMETRRRVGYLSETNPLYESLNVWETLRLFAQLRIPDKLTASARIDEVARQCSLVDVMHKDVGELSKGYRQRLGLALAILHDPDILILDEPTSALDPHQQQEVRDLIFRLKEKKTVLLSTHILPEAQRLCDRILILHQGRIAAEGTLDQLRQRLSGNGTLYVRFKGPAEALKSRLTAMNGVKTVQRQDEEEPGCPGFELTVETDIRVDLNGLAAEMGCPLLELRRPTAALDEIFRQVTRTP